jgi:hypothetical protein
MFAETRPMRAIALLCLFSLTGCVGSVRQEGFAATGPLSFLYSAHTNTVMTANDDGAAERLRRDWIADALRAHAMCADGYVIDSRRLVPDAVGPFGNGGDILYAGRCLQPLPPPATIVEEKKEKMFINEKIRGEKG